MTLQSGGYFGLGAATAGEIGLHFFQKRPDPKGKTNSAKARLRPKKQNLAKANFYTLWALKITRPHDSYRTERSKQSKGRSTSNAKIISETPSFQQSIQANKDKEGSQILNEKLKSGKRLRQQQLAISW